MSLWLMYALLAQYVVLSVVSIVEGRHWQAVYWLGAAVLTTGVLGMRIGSAS